MCKKEGFTGHNANWYDKSRNLLSELLSKYQKEGDDMVQVLERIQYTQTERTRAELIQEIKSILPKKYHQLPDDVLIAAVKSIDKYNNVYKSLADK